MTEEFAPAAYLRATIPASTPQSPIGWITGTGTSLTGNNASSHLGHRSMAGLSEPSGVYDYPFNTPRSSLVNSWWWANEAHDRFYDLGFSESAGNFQQDNFGLGGVGGDAMLVVELINHRVDNHFTPVTVDGGVSSINLGWTTCRFCADHDGLPHEAGNSPGERSAAYNRTIIFHEYAHGVSVRLVAKEASRAVSIWRSRGPWAKVGATSSRHPSTTPPRRSSTCTRGPASRGT